MKILVINGPNLNLLGSRNKEQYGSETLKDLENRVLRISKELEIDVSFRQSNSEGDIVTFIGSAKNEYDGIIINPAAYTHSSIAIRDAIEAVEIPTIEVHISNIYSREEFRHKSMISAVCLGQIAGLGLDGYELAIRALNKKLKSNK